MKRLLNKVENAHNKYEIAFYEFEFKIRSVCDFNARLTCLAGDGHLILNEETADVATLDCLNGITITNKLTEEEHRKFCI
jgi:spermidine synthase